jgi:hypothetical protein
MYQREKALDMRQQETRLSVRVGAPGGTSIGGLMGEMRTWFDHEGIQPIEFRSVTLGSGIAFDIGFRHLHQAALFRTAFR